MSKYRFLPENDGIDHINVYSRGKTLAGRMLTNFAATPFTMHGRRFASAEGFYQSMLFNDQATRLQIASTTGREAKRWGKKAHVTPGDMVLLWDGRQAPYASEEFYAEAMRGVRCKFEQNPEIAELLVATGDLPLEHYYVIWGKQVQPGGSREIFVATLHSLRAEFKQTAASSLDDSRA